MTTFVLSEPERRALLEHHAKELSVLRTEPRPGFGPIKRSAILERLKRMIEIAEELDQ